MGVNPTAIINGLGGGGGASADIIDYSQSDAKMLLALSQNPMDEDLRRKSSEAFLENFAEKIEKKMIAAGQTPTPAQVQEVMANEIIRGLEEATGAQSSDDAKTKIKALMEQSPSDFAQAMVDDYALVKARNARIVEERNAAAKADPPRQAQAEPQVGLMAILMTPVDVNGNQVTPRVDQIDVSNVDVDPYSQARASDNGLFAAAFSCMTDGGGCNGLARLYGVSFANINKDEYLVDGPRSEYERRALITGSLVGVPNANSSHGSEHSAIRFTQSVQYPPGVGDTLTYNAHIIAAFEKGGFTFEDDAAKQAMLVEMVRLADEGLRQRDFVKAINKFVVGHDGVTSNSELPGLRRGDYNPENWEYDSLPPDKLADERIRVGLDEPAAADVEPGGFDPVGATAIEVGALTPTPDIAPVVTVAFNKTAALSSVPVVASTLNTPAISPAHDPMMSSSEVKQAAGATPANSTFDLRNEASA